MYLSRIPKTIQRLSSAIWSMDDDAIYLTFDDGPSPNSDALLQVLDAEDVAATFFILGSNAERYPELMQRMVNSKHTLGNHGYEHLDGWRCDCTSYIENLKRGLACTPSAYYRPPYGRMTPSQWRISRTLQELVMWDVMPGDFDSSVDSETCISRTLEMISPGSIIVLHDNEKSHDTMIAALPQIIKNVRSMGLEFKALPPEGLSRKQA